MFKPNVLIYCFVVTVLIRRHRGLREEKHGYDSVICSAKGLGPSQIVPGD